jgi:AcrR family transcriptional regulator
MGRPVGQHHGDLRRALLAAALDLVEDGVDPSLRAVARRAGVSAGAPYHHFASKADLLAEVATEGFEALAEEQAAVAEEGGDKLAAMVAAYVRFARSHRTHYQVMFGDVLTAPGDAGNARLRAVAATTFVTLAAAVGAANLSLNQAEAHRRARLVFSMAHGVIALDPLRGPPGAAMGVVPAEEVGRAAHALAVDSR